MRATMAQRYRIDEQRTDQQHDQRAVEGASGRPGSRRRGVEQKSNDDHQQKVEGDEHVPLDVDPRPVNNRIPRKVTSRAANSGVKRRVNIGAMFPIKRCLASTSQDATTMAPAAPHGTSQCWMNDSG